MTRITLIAAVAENGVIGNQGEIPWRVPGEMAHFKATTLGHTLIMGRKTFESIGRVLPGRRTIVLTRDPEWHHLEVATARTLHDALQLAGAVDEVFIAGGAEIYAQALPLADRMILSEIPGSPAGDAYFPTWPAERWRETERVYHTGFTEVRFVASDILD
ncbi:MAG: dihydrofolate reductase [Actinobacteria bacterium]|uniref:Dihydrofolate reductase n=1 Tax=Nostocoides veronense TaxID=330836 RepID=A0ABN2LIY6_9MICO|nr:dihydrofolate reductase [Actinomycetota bacterium]